VGSRLMDALVAASEDAGYWTLQTAIFPENEASLSLHMRHGFRIVGTRERIGQHHGRWRDTVFLERRSGRAGA
jgi:arsenite methyltransferase